MDRVAQKWSESRVSVIETRPTPNYLFTTTLNFFPQQAATIIIGAGTVGGAASIGWMATPKSHQQLVGMNQWQK